MAKPSQRQFCRLSPVALSPLEQGELRRKHRVLCCNEDMSETNTDETRSYDIVIVGAGPAGLAAGLYAARARRSTLLIEKKVTGGQISLTADVENYPGIDNINGFDLADAMHKQAAKYGMQTAYAEVTAIDQQPDGTHLVRTAEHDYVARALILTGGADYNRLGVPGEDRLIGKGVSYCATCDAAFYKDQVVAVVGGGDAAMDEGLFVSRYASKVYVIHRRDQLRASAILQERAFAEPKMEFIWNTVVEEIQGKDAVSSLRLRDVVSGDERNLDVSGVFIFVGMTPNTDVPPREAQDGRRWPHFGQRVDGDRASPASSPPATSVRTPRVRS